MGTSNKNEGMEKKMEATIMENHLNNQRVLSRGWPNKPHDARDAGSREAAGPLQSAISPSKTLKIRAGGSLCCCKYQCG